MRDNILFQDKKTELARKGAKLAKGIPSNGQLFGTPIRRQVKRRTTSKSQSRWLFFASFAPLRDNILFQDKKTELARKGAKLAKGMPSNGQLFGTPMRRQVKRRG